MSVNSFDARRTLDVDGQSYEIYDVTKVDGSDSLPYSLKVLLENLLRTEDGANITAEQITDLGHWDADAQPSKEIQFTPARVIMQDFTGVPCIVDLATMREAVTDLGGDPSKVNPLSPAEMVIDHSVIVERRPSSRTRTSSTSATVSATSSCVGARPRSRTSVSSRRAPASSTRSTSSTSPA